MESILSPGGLPLAHLYLVAVRLDDDDYALIVTL